MATTWWRPSLKSCDQARRIGEENDDLFSKLPEEILMSIMSYLTVKEAARFSLVSRQCEVIWRYFPVLIFEDSKAKEKIWDNQDAIFEDRACFVRKVDRVLEKYLGTTIDELRITFDLKKSSQSYFDKWVAFALDKQVKRLELNLSPIQRTLRFRDGGFYPDYYTSLDLPPKLTGGFKSCLTSLCLRDVNVTDEFFDYLPHSCPLLETLCIENSRCLTRVTGSLQVKQLEVTYCHNLEKIEVSARKLNSLILYCFFCIEIHIVDAPLLFEMSIGSNRLFPDVFDCLSDVLSQLVYLNLRIDLARPLLGKLMNDVAMPKLEHLEFQVSNAMVHSSLYRCIIVLASSPNLQKLTLKLEKFGTKERNREVRRCVSYGSPIKCLKTLELVGYRGKPVDLELAFFVLENASMLEEIIVDFIIPLNDNVKRERLEMLKMKIPQGVKLTIK